MILFFQMSYLSPSNPAPMPPTARTYASPCPCPPHAGLADGTVGRGHGVASRTHRYHHGIRHLSFKNTSVFDVQCSVFGVRCSVFSVQCSVFGVPCSVFRVSGSGFMKHIIRAFVAEKWNADNAD